METQTVPSADVGIVQKISGAGSDIKSNLKKRSIKDLKNVIPDLWRNKEKRWILYIPIGLVALFIAHWIYEEFTTESTDDAFISGHVHVVGARVAGTVISIPVNDNQVVKKGDLLIKLDPKDFEVAQKIAQANVLKAHAAIKRWVAQGYLHPNEEIQKETDEASAVAADAAYEQATLNLQYTEIRASEDGRVGNRAVETGQQVVPAEALMALVERVPWVVANYKENQAAAVRPGQEAEIEVDAIPGKKFKGKVDSIAPGSGATFSLLPPDNATGNFTKIVQRIPVKVVFDPESIKGYEDRLVTGMSSVVTVHH